VATKRTGFFRNAYNAVIAARARQANSYVNGALLMLDDETLRAHGYDRAELRKQPHISSYI
jgi:secreted protein with Ig-like and vWFA domain